MQCVMQVGVVKRSVIQSCIRVHPAFHNKNLLTVLNGTEIRLASRHAKVRRDGYRGFKERRTT